MTKYAKTSKLYDILKTRTGAYNVLLNALGNTKQTGALKLLEAYNHNSFNTKSLHQVLSVMENDIENFNQKTNYGSRYLKYAFYAAVVFSCGYVSVKFLRRKFWIPNDQINTSSDLWANTLISGDKLVTLVGKLVAFPHYSIMIQPELLRSSPDGVKNFMSVSQVGATQTDANDLKLSLSPVSLRTEISNKIAATVVAPLPDTSKRQLDLSLNFYDVFEASSFTKRITVCTLGGIGSFITLVGTIGCVAPLVLIVPAAIWNRLKPRSLALSFAIHAAKPVFAGPAILVGSVAIASSFAKLMDLF